MKRFHLTAVEWWQETIDWDADEKYLGLYLQTCSHRVSTEGLYRLLPQYVEIETGYSRERVTATFERLVARGWLGWDREHNVVLLRTAMERQPPKGDRQIKGAVAAIAQVPRSSLLFADFVALAHQHCPELGRLLERRDAEGPQPPSSGDQNPTDTPSVPGPTGTEGVSVDSSDPHPHSGSVPEGGGGERASADEPTGTGGVAPLCWPAATAALRDAGFSRDQIDRQRDALAAELRAEHRPIDWPAFGATLMERRTAGVCTAKTPLAALRFGLGGSTAHLLGERQKRQPGRRRPVAPSPPPDARDVSGPAGKAMWVALLKDAREHIGDDAWDTWLSVIQPAALTDTELWVAAPDHARSWISHRLLPLLSACATRTLDRPMTVRLTAGATAAVSA